MKDNKIGFTSEECCGKCMHAFDTDKIVSTCPVCGENVVACNSCSMDKNCYECVLGSNYTK